MKSSVVVSLVFAVLVTPAIIAAACPAAPACAVAVCNSTMHHAVVQAGKPDTKLSPTLCYNGTELDGAQSGEATVSGVNISSLAVIAGAQKFSPSFFKLYVGGIGHETLQKGQLETLSAAPEICVVLPIIMPMTKMKNCVQFQLTLPTAAMPSPEPEPAFETPSPTVSTADPAPPVESQAPMFGVSGPVITLAVPRM